MLGVDPFKYVGIKEHYNNFFVVYYTVNKHLTHYAFCTKLFTNSDKAYKWAEKYRLNTGLDSYVFEFQITKNGKIRRLNYEP